MRVLSTSVWDDKFFTPFIDFRNRIHRDIPTSFPETLADYSRYFGPDSSFLGDYNWEAFMVYEGDFVVAKAILCWRKNSTTGNLGFLDWENDLAAAGLLTETVEAAAKRAGLTLLKTPVDLNFYVKYRIRSPGGERPVWGEPVYPDYYHDLFRQLGFYVYGHWDSYRLKRFQAILDYFLKRLKLARKPMGSHSKSKDRKLRTTVRCVRLKDWDEELRIIHQLFTQAYQNMPEWEPITFDQFKVIYDDFKYIINPLFCYIVELRGTPVGFSINYADPLPVLSKVKGRNVSKLRKVLLLAQLRMNLSTFIIAHVGKISGPDGEEIKGVQIQVSKRIQLAAAVMRKVLVTFQMTDSPSRRSFEEKSQVLHAQYVLYAKDL